MSFTEYPLFEETYKGHWILLLSIGMCLYRDQACNLSVVMVLHGWNQAFLSMSAQSCTQGLLRFSVKAEMRNAIVYVNAKVLTLSDICLTGF